MKKIFKLFFNHWTLTILGLTAISALIWFIGPLIAFAEYYPLASDTYRIILIALIIIFYVGKLIWKFIQSKNLNVRFMEGLLQQTPAQQGISSTAGSEEVAMLQKRFEEAVNVLKNANLGKKHGFFSKFNQQYVYELPWYIFIGAPGSGKLQLLSILGCNFHLLNILVRKLFVALVVLETVIGGSLTKLYYLTRQADTPHTKVIRNKTVLHGVDS